MTRHLRFNTHIGREKPYTIDNREAECPFCDRSRLAGILDDQGDILYLVNKYPVLEDTFQTVIIETAHCESELSTYPREHLHRVMRFGVAKWLEMARDPRFASAVFYKNHGPHSGGSLRHPHMQIVGLHQVDYRQNVLAQDFEGLAIAPGDGVEFNLSTHPRVGFTEFNVILRDPAEIDRMADYVQVAAHYTLNGFNQYCSSYNLFFYELEGAIAAKLIPRFVMGPLYVGFSIPQVTNRLEEIVEAVRDRYRDDLP